MIAITFSGQGSHYENMGRALCQSSAIARKVYAQASASLGYDVLDLSLDQLGQTVYAQPAIVTFSLALWSEWQEKNMGRPQGFNLAGLAGFSLGEYSCLAAAGVLDLDQLLYLVQQRAVFMQEAAAKTKGGMAAVLGLADEDVLHVLAQKDWQGKVYPVNFNAPGQVVVSGLAEAIPSLARELQSAGARRVVPLKVSGAFHTPFMAQAAARLEDLASSLTFRQASHTLFSNLDGQPLAKNPAWPGYLARHLTSPVRWHELVKKMQESGAETFLEFGPGKVLTGLARKICPAAQAKNMDNPPS